MSDVASILVAEQDGRLGDEIGSCLEGRKIRIRRVHSGEELLRVLESGKYDLVFYDAELADRRGEDPLALLRKAPGDVAVVLCMEEASGETAVHAVREGAFDVIEKPVRGDRVRLILERALREQKGNRIRPQRARSGGFDLGNIVGESPAMRRVWNLVERVAPTDSTVLIRGESGTGKELIARAIHELSPRRDAPLVTLNCGAIPRELLESELFGFEKGAFTGAHRSRAGRFELAHNGTLFLDEIGDMSLALQVKLLRVLQEKTFERLGGANPIHVDVRIIAATHQDLEAGVREKTFRQDLYYRLNVFPIVLPPLRERKEDIPLLIDAILQRLRRKRNHQISGVADQAMAVLLNYDWPGNVRELENVLERAVILKDAGEIDLEDLPENICDTVLESEDAGASPPEIARQMFGSGPVNFSTAVSEFEKQLILEALDRSNWVKNRAAKLLNMKRTTLVEKMKRINLMTPQAKR